MKLTILIGLFLLSSCVTQKKCLLKFPVTSDTVRVVIIKDTVIYRDTTITVHIPGEAVTDTFYFPIVTTKPVLTDTVFLETKYARAWAFFKTPNLNMGLVQKEIYFSQKLDSVIRLEKHWKEQYDTITKVITKKHVPGIYKAALWFSIGAIIILLLGFLRLLKK